MMRGILTLELLIAFAVATTILVAAMLVAYGSPFMVTDSRLHREALGTATALLRGAIAVGEADPALVAPHASSQDEFESSLGLRGSAWTTLIASAATTWHDGRAQERTLMLLSFLTDYEHPSIEPCNPFPSGDWSRPKQQRLTDAPLPRVVALAATPTRLAAVASVTDAVSDPDFFLFSIASDASLGHLLSYIDTASTTRGGLQSVTLARDQAFVGSNVPCLAGATCMRIGKIDLSRPDEPSFASAWDDPNGSAVRVLRSDGSLLYAGLEKHGGPEFRIFDMRDPVALREIGSAEAGSSVSDILLAGPDALVATSDNRSGGAALLAIPRNAPYPGISPSFATSTPGGGFAHSLAEASGTIYLGRSLLANSKELLAFSGASRARLPVAIDLLESVISIAAQGDLLFILMRSRLEIWNVRTESLPRRVQAVTFSGATALVCSGDALFIASVDADGQGRIDLVRGS